MRPKAAQRQQIGRPPAGLRQGERVKDYPQVSVRLPPDAQAKLAAMSKVQSKPQWRIVIDALECYYNEQSSDERELAEQFVRETQRPCPDGASQ